MGLLISTFMRSQIAAIFGTAVLTIVPAVQFSGLLDPVSSLEGAGAVIGKLFPTTYYLIVSRGPFSKEIGRAPSELQSLMRISYAVFCLTNKRTQAHKKK